MKDYGTTKDDGLIRKLAKELRFAHNQEVILEEGEEAMHKLHALSESFTHAKKSNADLEMANIDELRNQMEDENEKQQEKLEEQLPSTVPADEPKKKHQRVFVV
jgi:hypothetical protein